MHLNIKNFEVGYPLHSTMMGPIEINEKIFLLSELDNIYLDIAYLYHSGDFEYVRTSYYPDLITPYPIEVLSNGEWVKFSNIISTDEIKDFLKIKCGDSIAIPMPCRIK